MFKALALLYFARFMLITRKTKQCAKRVRRCMYCLFHVAFKESQIHKHECFTYLSVNIFWRKFQLQHWKYNWFPL